MPLWRIFSDPSTFNTAQKAALAKSITTLYTDASLPAFYVDVIFIPIENNSFYVGSKPQSNMVRIGIEHIAIHQPKSERSKMLDRIDEVSCPRPLRHRGYVLGFTDTRNSCYSLILLREAI